MNDSNIINTKLYDLVSKSLTTHDASFRKNIAKFIQDRHEYIFAMAPYDRIYFNQTDIDDMYNSLGIKESVATQIMTETAFWNIGVNPQCVKEPYVEVLMCAIRYYLKTAKPKNALITAVYLAFSGKFYASIHGAAFPTVPPSKYKSVMDYVINNMLTDKFDIKKYGSVFGAIEHICQTWLETYGNKIKTNLTEYELKNVIQQLRSREMSFMMNIAKLYYEAYENKYYLNYETENEDEEKGAYRLTTNDSATAARITEKATNYLLGTYVSLEICNKCKDSNVKATEVKDIMEAILADKNNLGTIKRLINIIIVDFMMNNPGVKLDTIDFVVFTLKAKPNTHNELELEIKEIILRWLDENSPNYRRRKTREATANSYYKSILTYFTLVINKVAK